MLTQVYSELHGTQRNASLFPHIAKKLGRSGSNEDMYPWRRYKVSAQ